jgi:hypothetical protein
MIPHAESKLLAVLMSLVTWASDQIVGMWYQILTGGHGFHRRPGGESHCGDTRRFVAHSRYKDAAAAAW